MAFFKPAMTCQIPELGRLYDELFPRKRDGTFVEVGAFDGESCSNTSCLADMGWRGIYLEPVPDFAEACAKRHANNPAIEVRCVAIGLPGAADLYLAGPLSTTKQDVAAAYERTNWARTHCEGKTLRVQMQRLDVILLECAIAPEFDLLVVDVEGAENEVFDSFSLRYWKPRVIIVELVDEHPSFQRFPEIVANSRRLRDRIASGRYAAVFRDSINTIFVST